MLHIDQLRKEGRTKLDLADTLEDMLSANVGPPPPLHSGNGSETGGPLPKSETPSTHDHLGNAHCLDHHPGYDESCRYCYARTAYTHGLLTGRRESVPTHDHLSDPLTGDAIGAPNHVQPTDEASFAEQASRLYGYDPTFHAKVHLAKRIFDRIYPEFPMTVPIADREKTLVVFGAYAMTLDLETLGIVPLSTDERKDVDKLRSLLATSPAFSGFDEQFKREPTVASPSHTLEHPIDEPHAFAKTYVQGQPSPGCAKCGMTADMPVHKVPAKIRESS